MNFKTLLKLNTKSSSFIRQKIKIIARSKKINVFFITFCCFIFSSYLSFFKINYQTKTTSVKIKLCIIKTIVNMLKVMSLDHNVVKI